MDFLQALEKVQQELIDLREKFKALQICNKDLTVRLRLKEGNVMGNHSKSKALSPLELQLKSASSYIKKYIALSDPLPNVSREPGFFSQPHLSTDFLDPEV